MSALLIACKYALKPILLVRICVITELIALCANMGVEGRLFWPYPKFEKLSSMPGRFLGSFLLASHRLTDGGFRGCC